MIEKIRLAKEQNFRRFSLFTSRYTCVTLPSVCFSFSISFGKEAFLWQPKCKCLLKRGSLLPAEYAYRPNSGFDPLILPRSSGRRRLSHCGLFDWPQPVPSQYPSVNPAKFI